MDKVIFYGMPIIRYVLENVCLVGRYYKKSCSLIFTNKWFW